MISWCGFMEVSDYMKVFANFKLDVDVSFVVLQLIIYRQSTIIHYKCLTHSQGLS